MTRSRKVAPTLLERLDVNRRHLGQGDALGRYRGATRAPGAVNVAYTPNAPGGDGQIVGCVLAASGTVTIPAGGGGIVDQLTTELERVGFPDAPLGEQWRMPFTATYWVGVGIRATDGYRGGGPVSATLTPDGASSVAETLLFAGTSRPWAQVREPQPIAANAGEALDILMAPTDGLSHTAEVALWVALLEPITNLTRDTLPLQITEAIPVGPIPPGSVFFDETFGVVWDGTGTLVLAANSDGTGTFVVDDVLTLDGPGGQFVHDFSPGCVAPAAGGPFDVSAYLQAGANSVRVRLSDNCGTTVAADGFWLVKIP